MIIKDFFFFFQGEFVNWTLADWSDISQCILSQDTVSRRITQIIYEKNKNSIKITS